jgi:hypothetical protein
VSGIISHKIAIAGGIEFACFLLTAFPLCVSISFYPAYAIPLSVNSVAFDTEEGLFDKVGLYKLKLKSINQS